ncbi:hypothetical protein CEB3_c00100 [Peptococcaceae bacterium CEB3]|nr:hypothetical protein CEB3_c00100 [Peptococcaceae bacterium CEB3]
MTNSKNIAKLIGPTIIVITTSETINLHIWASNLAPVTYLNGILLFIAGLSIIRVHNHWTKGWPLLITLAGWVGIIGGLYRAFFPEAQQLSENIPSYLIILGIFVVGVILTYKDYTREDSKTVAKK